MNAATISRRFTNSFWKFSIAPCISHDCFPVSFLYFSTSAVKNSVRHDMLLEILMNKHHLAPQVASQIASGLSSLRDPGKTDEVMSFFKENGFSSSQLEKIAMHRPQLLTTGIEKMIKPKIKILQDLGYSSDELAELISNRPWILHCGQKKLASSISVLKGLMGSNAEVARLLAMSGLFLTQDLRKNLVPNAELLTNCGVSLDQIVNHMFLFPRLLLNDPETMRKFVEKADAMGVKRSGKMFVHAVRVFGCLAEETWQSKLKVFRGIGFSEEDIVRVFRQAPNVFMISAKKINEVTELVLSTQKYDISCIVAHPTALCRSVQKCYKPRFRVLDTLGSKNLIKNWPSFSVLSKMSDKAFVEKYVAPYKDVVGDVYYGIDHGSTK